LSLGFNYTLPLLLVFQAEVFTDGNVRLQLLPEDIPLSPRLRGRFMVNADKEYMVGLGCVLYLLFTLSTHYDSDMDVGFGVSVTY
jgi:hypothetical protein